MVALNWALIRVTQTGELLTYACMLKVAMLTSEAEEEIDGTSSQSKVTSTLHLSLVLHQLLLVGAIVTGKSILTYSVYQAKNANH